MIETERLIVRPWRESDRATFLATCNTDAVTRYLGGPSTEVQLDAALGRIAASQATNGFCFWAVERTADRAFLGYCGLKVANQICKPLEGEIEIGWRLREDAWGRGYAREAAQAVLNWAWTNLDIPRVIAFTVPPNEASWGLMIRLGMVARPAFDFNHPSFETEHRLSRHVVYMIDRPRLISPAMSPTAA